VSTDKLQAFLGRAVASVIEQHLLAGITDLRLIDVSEFDVTTMLRALVKAGESLPKIAIAGANVRELSRASGYARQSLSESLSTAATWRNDGALRLPRIVIASSDDEKVGTFHRIRRSRINTFFK
jgi:hypothetical protein